MFDSLADYFRTRYRRWINRRLPIVKSITLDQRRIFIFPSKPGLWFLVLLLVMLIAAINYQNNMAFALVFLLSSVFIVTVLHTFANLSGLTITALKSEPVFVGDNAAIAMSVTGPQGKDYFDVTARWPDSEVSSVSLRDSSEQLINLHLPMDKRGLFSPERLLVETFYPFGLLRAWTWLGLDIEIIVYPKPIRCKLQCVASEDQKNDGEIIPVVGSDDFYEFRQYKPGDSLKHAHWKGYAKQQELQTKHFASFRENQLWLDWESFDGDVEQRLSKICYWVLKLEKSDDDYGLRLPGVTVEPSHGIHHQTGILKELALFQPRGVDS